MTIQKAIEIFYSGEKLKFGYEPHIEARNLLRSLRRNSKYYKQYLQEKSYYATKAS
jgi:hypothetical protein